MTREIKFRAWNKITESMTPWEEIENGSQNKLKENFDEMMNRLGDVLMQYTGLKDKNGKEIYEGDIVKRIGRIHVVKWQDEKAKFVCYDPFLKNPSYWGLTSAASKDYQFEIIGNIYENPELLK